MKTVLAFAVLLGVALSNSTGYYGWAPGKEVTFHFQSEQLTGIPEIANQWAGLKIASDVKVQAFNDYSLRIKFVDPKFIQINEQLPVENGVPQVPRASQELPGELAEALRQPFVAHLKRGVAESLFVEASEPVAITNIKKALLSQLQMDLSGSRRFAIDSNVLPKSAEAKFEQAGEDSERVTYFSTEEQTILGDCQTSYTITPVPAYLAKDMEARWATEAKAAKESGSEAGKNLARGAEYCEGKSYWEIVKSTNFDNCKESPVLSSWMGLKGACDVTKSGCKDMLTHTASTRYVVCGSSPSSFVIRSAKAVDAIVSQPMGWQTGAEKIQSTATVSLVLKEVSSSFQPLPKPQQPKEKQALIFQYPKGHAWSSEAVSREVTKSEEAESYYPAVLPMPSLNEPSLLMPSPLPASEIISKIADKVVQMTRQLFSPEEMNESCSNRADVAGNVAVSAQYLRILSSSEIKSLYSKVRSELSQRLGSEIPQAEKVGMELLRDIMAMSGSNPSAVVLLEKIQSYVQSGSSSEFSNGEAAMLISSLIRNVRTPTQELLGKIFSSLKSIRPEDSSRSSFSTKRSVYNSGLVQLANLINKACVNPASRETNFPVRIYGQFCNNRSAIVSEEIIPYLSQRMESAPRMSQSLVYVAALSKIGTTETLVPLAKAIEGKVPSFMTNDPNIHERRHPSPMARSIAVYGLRRAAQLQPALVRPILLSLIDNNAENTQVRIAAVAILPFAQPSVAELQKIAVRSWFEPSKQVASFIFSTLKALPHTEIPELKPVGVKAQTIANLVKPFQWGVQYSQNLQSNQWVPYLRVGSNSILNYVATEEDTVPAHLAVVSGVYGGLWETPELTFAAYSQGMDQILDKVINGLGYGSKASESVRSQIRAIRERLNIKTRKYADKALAMDVKVLGLERFYAFDKESFSHMMEEISEEMRRVSESAGSSYSDRHYSYRRTLAQKLVSVEAYGPSTAGFPLYVQKTFPIVLSAKANITVSGAQDLKQITGSQSGLTIPTRVQADVTPTLNTKIETSMGAISPFTKEFVGAGFEACVHSSVAANLKVEYHASQKSVSLTLKNGEEAESQSQTELFHAYCKPYTVAKKSSEIIPIAKAPSAKIIRSGNQARRVEFPIFRSIGLSARFEGESDYTTASYGSIISMLEQHNIMSLVNTGYMMPSVRYASAKVTYSPSQSKTQEVHTSLIFKSHARSVEREQEQELEQGIEIDSQSEYYVSPSKSYEHSLKKEVEAACEQSYSQHEEQQSKSKKVECMEKRAKQVEQLADSAEEACESAESTEYETESEKKACRKAQKVCRIAEEICSEAAEQLEEQSGRYTTYSPKSQECKQTRRECLNRRYTIHKMEKLAKSVRHSESVSALHIESQLVHKYATAGSSENTLNVMLVAAASKTSPVSEKPEAAIQAIVTIPRAGKYQATLRVASEIPRVRSAWNLEQLLSESTTMKNEISLTYGKGSSASAPGMKRASASFSWEKTEGQKEFVRRQPLARECQELRSREEPISSACMELYHLAASVDKTSVTVSAPKSWAYCPAFEKLSAYVEGHSVQYMGLSNIVRSLKKLSQEGSGSEGRVEARANVWFAHQADSIAKVEIESPVALSFYNLRLPKQLHGLFPLSLKSGVLSRFEQKLTRDQAPASCRLMPKIVSTFDNRTYHYKINDCEHLLFQDCSGERPIAVSAESVSASRPEEKNVKFIAGHYTVMLKSAKIQRSSQPEITVNGQTVSLSKNAEPKAWYRNAANGAKQLELTALATRDGVVNVHNHIEGLELNFDGTEIEVIAPQNLHNRACGLCGDLNLENTADLKTPKGCIMRNDKWNAQTYMQTKTIEGGSCAGIPHAEKAKFEEERERNCAFVKQIPTQVTHLAKVLSSAPLRPVAAKHIVKEERNQICASKARVVVCPAGTRPAKLQTVFLPFACVTKPGMKAQQIKERIEAGDLVSELNVLPTVFTAKRQMAASCVPEGSKYEEEQNNYRNTPRW